MNERNLFERAKRVALTFNVFMKASFLPGRLIVNKIKARRFTLAGLRLSDGAKNNSGIAVYRPCITEQIVGVGNALIFLVPARTR